MSKIFAFTISLNVFILSSCFGKDQSFDQWLIDFKKQAIAAGVSKFVVNDVMAEAKFLPKVIEYDRYQPEFYEDTFTYIKKRTSKKKVNAGLRLYKKEKKNN